MNRLTTIISMLFLTLVSGCSTPQDKQETVKNVIFIVGDGMGINQTMAVTDTPNAFYEFTNTAIVTTASANNRVTDSAAGATALFTGNKTNNSFVGTTPDSAEVANFAEKCEAKGIKTGIVTLCSFTHATPAGFYAHSTSRDAEPEIIDCFMRSGLDVVFTGGSKDIDPALCGSSARLDSLKAMGYNVILDDFDAVSNIPEEWENIIFLPYGKDFPEEMDKRIPYSLNTCTEAALDILSRNNSKGFMLMIEESQIDWACHANDNDRLVMEMNEINKTMLTAKEYADNNPGTLVIVVADHETGGLTYPSNDTDFRKAESGINNSWATSGHTGGPVGLFAYGTGADEFHGIIDNTEVHNIICRLLGI